MLAAGMNAKPSCDVETLVPHRCPMRLVRTLRAAGERWAETETVVEPGWPTVEEDGVDPVLLIELIAQSVAVHTGWLRRSIEPLGGRGLLVGVRQSTLAPGRVALGTGLRTRVEQVRQVEGYVVFTGEVRAGERVLCTAEVQAFRPDEERTA